MHLLRSLRVDEVSGVSDPAHDLPGFVLRKDTASPIPPGLTLMRLGDEEHRGFWSGVDGIEKRLGDDHFEQVVECFKEYTAKARMRSTRHNGGDERGRFARKPEGVAADEPGTLPWRHLGAAWRR
jgi:hypothetical protein